MSIWLSVYVSKYKGFLVNGSIDSQILYRWCRVSFFFSNSDWYVHQFQSYGRRHLTSSYPPQQPWRPSRKRCRPWRWRRTMPATGKTIAPYRKKESATDSLFVAWNYERSIFLTGNVFIILTFPVIIIRNNPTILQNDYRIV